MSTDALPPDDLVVRCSCKHRPPLNGICQFVPAVSCGGPSKCRICAIAEPADEPIPPATSEPTTSDTPDVAIESIDLQWSIDIPPTMMP